MMAEPVILDPKLPTKLIYQFPKPTWIENISVRSNGHILVTLMTTPELYLIDPKSPSEAVLVYHFPSVSALMGIIEIDKDKFYVAGGNYSTTTWSNEAGSYSIWEVDLSSFDEEQTPKVRKVATLPDAGLLNGLERSDGSILAADSEVGCVWKVDAETGSYEKMIHVTEMSPPPLPAIPMGINGIKLKDSYLYWTNTGKMTFCRVQIGANGHAVGDVEIIAKNWLVDDFVFDAAGKPWFAQNVMNTVGSQKKDGGMAIVAGSRDDFEVSGGTACQFGRGEGDQHILYVVTTGALAGPVNGATEGGKIVAVDASSFSL